MPQTSNILSRWQSSVHGTSCSPLEFFDLVESGIRETGISGLSFTRVARRETHKLSADRIYLRIRFGAFFFDVSAFVFGNVLVVGYWLHRDPTALMDLVSEIPILGWLARATYRSATYYRVDRAEAFQHAIHESILSVIGRLKEEARGSYPSEGQPVPVWEELLG